MILEKGGKYMTNPRVCLYIKDEEILSHIRKNRNHSEYVERAVRFYEENKDILKKISDALLLNEKPS